MIVASAAVALFIAALSTLAIARALDWPHSKEPALFFFLLAFLFVLNGGLWVMPIGPELYGAPFIPMLVMGMLCSLSYTAAFPPQLQAPTARFGTMYWVLIVALLTTVLVWYLV